MSVKQLKKLLKRCAAKDSDQDDEYGGDIEATADVKLPERALQSDKKTAEQQDADRQRRHSNDSTAEPSTSARRSSDGSSAALHRTTSIASSVSMRSASKSRPRGHINGGTLRQRTASIKTGKSAWRFPQSMPIQDMLPSMTGPERTFMTRLYQELEKVDSFFKERETEAVAKVRLPPGRE